MKECNIIRDLLPLYAEELTSSDSGEFIEKHLSTCADCRTAWRRCREELPPMAVAEEQVEAYRKPLKQSVLKIILSSILAVAVGLGIFGYLMWEWGYLGEERIIQAPDGGSLFRIKYYNDDGFFVQGGAYVVLPDGTGRNLRGDDTFVDLHVWWAPNGEAFFAWWEFTDHDEAYYVDYRDIEAAGGWKSYKESRDVYSENFFAELETLCAKQGVTVSDLEFLEWSDDSRYLCFRYQTEDGSGKIEFDLENKDVGELGVYQILEIPVECIDQSSGLEESER